MSLVEVRAWKVVCDEPGCGMETGDIGDYAFWGESADAVDQWVDYGGMEVQGRHYCEGHSRGKQCEGCDATGQLVEVNGEWLCPECREVKPDA